MEDLIKKLPKIELHAHLNGSFTVEILEELAKTKFGDETPEYEEYKAKILGLKDFSSKNLSECFQVFKIAHELITDLQLLEKATILVIKHFLADNTMYLELRTTLKAAENFTKEEYLETIVTAILQCKIVHPEIVVKLMPSFDRARGIEDAEDSFKVISASLERYPDVICGIDLSGDPCKGTFDEYKPLLGRAKLLGLKLSLHCAEVDGFEDEVNDMIQFGMDRLGHGTFIKNESFEALRERNICVECCLTSNVKCATVKTFSDHHFKEMFFKHKVPVVICTDDCGVFDTCLTKELLIAIDTFELKISDIIRLSEIAIEHSFTMHLEKTIMRNKIHEYFKIQAGQE